MFRLHDVRDGCNGGEGHNQQLNSSGVCVWCLCGSLVVVVVFACCCVLFGVCLFL